MVDTSPRTPAEFTAEDRLRLQQLSIRKVLATRDAEESDKDKKQDDDRVRSAPSRWRLLPSDTTLYKWQQECLEIWLKQRRGTVKVATGAGKTTLALAAAQALQQEIQDLRLVVVVPTIPLMNQWREELDLSNMPVSKIALMGSGKKVPDDPDIRIVICVINSARDHLPALVERMKWSKKLLLVVDECHRANATQARRIFDSNPAFTLGLSATPEPPAESETDQFAETDDSDVLFPADEREHDDNKILPDSEYDKSPVGQHIGPIIFDFSLKDAMEAGLLTPFEVWHVGLPLEPVEDAEYQKLSRGISRFRKKLQAKYPGGQSGRSSFFGWVQSTAKRGDDDAEAFVDLVNKRKRLLYRATARYSLSLEILHCAMSSPDHRVILFHEVIDNVNEIFLAAEKVGLPAVLEHSKLPKKLRDTNIDLFRRGDARIIVSARSLVEGFNVPSADIGIIAASSGSVRQRIQSLGRMLRKKESREKAIVFVLYVKDTTDEGIYEKVDWEDIIGAQRNRYFELIVKDGTNEQGSPEKNVWYDVLLPSFREIETGPRRYRPSCRNIPAHELAFGGDYPAQTVGLNLRFDCHGNLKAENGDLVKPNENAAINRLRELHPHAQRAVLTPCNHLICRGDARSDANSAWIFLGIAEIKVALKGEKLRIKGKNSRRKIVRTVKRGERYAKNPENVITSIRKFEETHSIEIKHLYWDQGTEFWVEIGGDRYKFTVESGLTFRS